MAKAARSLSEASNGRTEIEVAADTVAALIRAGVITDRVGAVGRAAEASGLMAGDIALARQRYRARGFVAPKRSRTTPAGTEAEAPVPAADRARRAWNRAPEGDRRRCIRCKDVKPIEEFQQRTDQPTRRTVCDECRKSDQRERYLSVAKTKQLNAVGLTFVVGDEDDVAGLLCVGCERPILVDQEVFGHTSLRHTGCPDRPKS